jgi:hypothetical protein
MMADVTAAWLRAAQNDDFEVSGEMLIWLLVIVLVVVLIAVLIKRL